MQHASETIGAIAGALAKAQVDLVNPEKSLVATISAPESREGERIFRYAPLSSGLDTVRRSLGRQEIATVQTTSIDHGAGLIRLTTVLAHSSGEWISSEFPVCPLSETAAPHRLGAALTYARRFALFTLVGIAGEDDTDAPDLPSRGAELAPVGTSGGYSAVSRKPRTNSPWKSSESPPSALSPERSAELRDQLKSELAGLASSDGLTAWTSRVLPVKASLTRDDANALEQAFAQRMSSVALAGSDLARPGGSPDGELLVPTNGDARRKVTPIPKTQRRRDREHLRFVRTQPCLVCGRAPSDPHHLRFAEPRALGRKVSDEFTVPLCRSHHRALHRAGDERDWWEALQIDPTPIAEQLWRETRDPLP